MTSPTGAAASAPARASRRLGCLGTTGRSRSRSICRRSLPSCWLRSDDMTSRPALHELAAYCGILPCFVDWRGNPRDTTDEARETLLAAMRLDAGTEESARRALDELRTRDDTSTEVAILSAAERVVEGRLPGRLHGSGEQGGEIVLRDAGGEVVRARTRMSIENGTARVAVPPDVALPPGYYDAELSIDDDRARNPHAWFVLAPPASCVSVAQRCGRDRAFGVMLNLYSVRSRENWGIGDLSDVARVSR